MKTLTFSESNGSIVASLDGALLDVTMTRNLLGFLNAPEFEVERDCLADQLEEIFEEGE